jgi:drug/metabolite transporter (DMT)-like permease
MDSNYMTRCERFDALASRKRPRALIDTGALLVMAAAVIASFYVTFISRPESGTVAGLVVVGSLFAFWIGTFWFTDLKHRGARRREAERFRMNRQG